jgi:predicted pyridoxine 5'-phosphate oxidase superfamily flavin-nucleotide-binding protein
MKSYPQLPKPAQKALDNDAFPKFAATMSNEGVPNVVPLLTTNSADATTLIFARFMVWKTARNLEANGKIAVNVIGPGLCSWIIRGQFQGFVRQGPYLDHYNRKALFRYNAYAGAVERSEERRVGKEC